MLLNERELPEFGTLDYLVEAALSNVDERFITELVGDSFLGGSGARVAVVPAIGSRTLENPENALAKIARAYLEVPQETGLPRTLSEQFERMLKLLEESGAYDVVLVDARAGLHESAPAALLGIGAEVLLFGLDQPQTFQSYKLLFAHLARFLDSQDDWRDRFSFVHAKAPDSPSDREDAAARFNALYDVLSETNAPAGRSEPLTAEDFDLRWEDSAMDDSELSQFERPPILYVLDDNRYRNFDPIANRRILESSIYASSFGALLDYVDSLVGIDDPDDEASLRP